jgi:hypothetical protein
VQPPDGHPEPQRERPAGRISLQTLIIASVASAAASFAASRIWGPGTLVSAAATPVVVALVSEFLRRPVQTAVATAKKVPPVQAFPDVLRRGTAVPEDLTSGREEPAELTPDPATRTEPSRFRPRWRLAVGTGLVAFAIVLAFYTVPDLLAGRSITGNGQPTTFFGGSTTVKSKPGPAKTVTTTTPTKTVTRSGSTTTTTTATSTPATTSSTSTTSASTSTTTTGAASATSTTPPATSTATTTTTHAP